MLLPLVGMVGVHRRREYQPVLLACVLAISTMLTGCPGSEPVVAAAVVINELDDDDKEEAAPDRSYRASSLKITAKDTEGQPVTLVLVDVQGGAITVK